MIKKNIKMLKNINSYYNFEMAAHNKYLNYAAYFDMENIDGYSKFLLRLAKDKIEAHMTRTFKFLSNFDFPANINNECVIKTIKYSEIDQKNLEKSCLMIFEDVLETELNLREAINKIAIEALEEKDIEIFNWAQWFVSDALKDISEVENIIFSLKNSNISLLQKLAEIEE
ncbi:MAG: ferritin-like domain-containing protein [Mycoplasmoidaceae bacterium]